MKRYSEEAQYDWHDMVEDPEGEWMRADEVLPRIAELEARANPQDLLNLLRGEFASLSIGFNEDHACNYVIAAGWRDEYGFYGGGRDDDHIQWPSDEERDKAVRENSVWTIQWYPDTPVGFYCVGASTFEAAAKYALTFAERPTDGR
jgi:hypothetical protein